ncbi:MAG: ribbon-helix-helix protein, CopG family [Alphaproteobacteria bacterium]|nr:ribbon-helix-helix protein, CopG family [Alphaproteobacteria bacterium]
MHNTISLKISHTLTKKLDSIALTEDRSRSSLIRKIITNYIEEHKKEFVASARAVPKKKGKR